MILDYLLLRETLSEWAWLTNGQLEVKSEILSPFKNVPLASLPLNGVRNID